MKIQLFFVDDVFIKIFSMQRELYLKFGRLIHLTPFIAQQNLELRP